MKLEYLDDLTGGGKFPNVVSENLIRLYHFNKDEARKFSDAINQTILTARESLDLTSLDFIQPVNCKLTFVISEKDEGITTTDKKTFVCKLTLDSYQQMTGLIKGFWAEDSSGYNWLYDLDVPIDLLFSPGGTW